MPPPYAQHQPVIQPAILAFLLSLLGFIFASFYSLDLQWRALFSGTAIHTSADFFHGFLPPALTHAFLLKVGQATLETLAMSAVGTGIACFFGSALALPASGRLGTWARRATRLLLNLLRSIPELVWALILLIAVGLGPFAGTLALAVHTTGVLGRLMADALENLPTELEASLQVNGASPFAAFCYAALPQVLPQWMSYTLYRWENNIRAAAVLGIVGAGGLGQMLKFHLALFQMQEAATVIIATLLLIALVDSASFKLRHQFSA